MLTFFRKYQKTFFAVVAVFTISSFLFFGSYGAMQGKVSADDKPAGMTLDGKVISTRKLDLLTRFLATSFHEKEFLEQKALPNLLNDGVLQTDFFETGFASLLAQKHFDLFKEEWEAKLERIKTFEPYKHPVLPISAKEIWSHFYSPMVAHFDACHAKSEFDPEAFHLLYSLYLDQTRFPPSLLKQLFLFHERQYPESERDWSLQARDLSLFGFRTLEDWLGRKYLMSVAEAILNGAAVAKAQGCSIDRSEALLSLKNNIRDNYTKLFDKEIALHEIDAWYHRAISALYSEEDEVLDLWSDILLFRKYFQEVPSKINIDSTTSKDAAKYASEALRVDLYHFPEYLELKTLRDLMKLQVYIESISSLNSKRQSHHSLSLPILFQDPVEVEKRSPELVQTNYDIELQEIDLDTLALEIGLKEAHVWEQEENHREELAKAFPQLKDHPQGIEGLSLMERAKIDRYAKKKIVLEKQDYLASSLEKAPKKRMSLGFRKEGGDLALKGTIDREELKRKLDSCETGGSFVLRSGDHSYRITLISSQKTPKILTFQAASMDGTLDLLLDRALTQAYPEIKRKRPNQFAKKEGGFKSLKEVEDQVGAEVFATLLQKIQEETKRLGIQWPESQSLDHYVKYRLIVPLQEAKSALVKGIQEESQDELSSQWHLVKEEKRWNRLQAAQEKHVKLFDQKENRWSSLHMKKSGAPYFYYIHGKEADFNSDSQMAKVSKELLMLDAKRELFSELIDKMSVHDLIAFSP
jgi:hypothetical protein